MTNKKDIDPLRYIFKEDYEYLDWFHSLSEDERYAYAQSHATILKDEQEDPTIIQLKDGETVDDWIKKYNLHDVTEIIER